MPRTEPLVLWFITAAKMTIPQPTDPNEPVGYLPVYASQEAAQMASEQFGDTSVGSFTVQATVETN